MKSTYLKIATLGLLTIAATGFADTHHHQSAWRPAYEHASYGGPYYIGPMIGVGEGTGNADMGFAFGFDGGYRFNSNVAADFNFVGAPTGSGKSSGDSHSLLFGAGVKGILPLAAQFDTFGKLGLAIVHDTDGDSSSSDSDTHLGFLLGAGVDYHFLPTIDFTGQIIGSTGGTGTDTFSVLFGANYLFG